MKKQERVIIIDSREASTCPEIKKLLSKHFTVDIQPLESADYVLSKTGKMKGSIGIERKTVNDLLSSIIDGRLFNQVIKLCDTYEYPVLLIEGSLYPFKSDPVLLGSYISLLYSFKKLKVAHSRDIRGSVRFITRSALYIGPTGHAAPKVKEKAKTAEQAKIAMLMTLKGIGMKTAKEILQRAPRLFNSVYTKTDLKKRLEEVKGLRKDTKQLLLEIFG